LHPRRGASCVRQLAPRTGPAPRPETAARRTQRARVSSSDGSTLSSASDEPQRTRPDGNLMATAPITIDTDDATLTAVTSAAERAAAEVARSTLTERAAWLTAVADAIDAAADELVDIADRETALGET